MREKGVIFSDHTNISRIEGSTVYAERNGEKIEFSGIDIVIVSSGMKSNNPLEAELAETTPVYVIGDARVVGDAQDAIRDGFFTAASL